MPDIALFGEDQGHESFLGALIARFSRDYRVEVTLRTFNATGGMTKVHYAFKKFLRDVDRSLIARPDLIVVATDSNCMGYPKRKQQMEEVASASNSLSASISYAIPDPHIERWMLVDPEAFKEAVGQGCQPLQKIKCSRDNYKAILEADIRAAGKAPLIGGFEYAEDIVNAMDLAKVEQSEPSLEKLLKDLKGRFNSWSSSDSADTTTE